MIDGITVVRIKKFVKKSRERNSDLRRLIHSLVFYLPMTKDDAIHLDLRNIIHLRNNVQCQYSHSQYSTILTSDSQGYNS